MSGTKEKPVLARRSQHGRGYQGHSGKTREGKGKGVIYEQERGRAEF